MIEYVVRIDGGRGTLLVDGMEPDAGPGAVVLLDRWLAGHVDEPGGALIAKARELLTGSAS